MAQCGTEYSGCLADEECSKCSENPDLEGCDENPLFLEAITCACSSCEAECGVLFQCDRL